jgi:hypothetical protein
MLGTASLQWAVGSRREVAAMGGPWRERGFDPASLRSPRAHRGVRTRVAERERAEVGLNKVVLAFIAAVAMTFGLMVSLMQRGW